MDGADARAGQEGDEGLGDHGQVDGDRVALAHAHLLEDVGDLGDLAEQLAVRDIAALAGLVGLVDDGHLVWVLEGVAVDAVERGVELAFEEPGIVAAVEGTAVDCLKGLAPGEQLVGEAPPELGGLCDGLLVELLVLVEAWWGGNGLACVWCRIPVGRSVAQGPMLRRDAVGTKVAVLTAEVRLAGVLCCGSGLAPVSQNFRLSMPSKSSPAATPPSIHTLLLPRIPSLPRGVLGGYVLSSIFWGGSGEKAVSRFVQSKIASPVPIRSPSRRAGFGSLRKVSTSWASATTGFLGASQAMMGGCVC